MITRKIRHSKYVSRSSGFTLIELLVVIAIVSVLAATVLSALRTTREKAYDAQIRSDMSQIRNALELYANDNGYIYPPIARLGSQTVASEATNLKHVSLLTKMKNGIRSIFGSRAYAQSRDLNCQHFDTLESILVPDFLGAMPKHPLDDGLGACYKYFASSDRTSAVVYASLVTDRYSNGINKQIGVIMGDTDSESLSSICNENLTYTNANNGNSGASPFPMFSANDHCSGDLADEVLGVGSGGGIIALSNQCTLPQYTNQYDCTLDRSSCSDPSYSDQQSCEANGVTVAAGCSDGSYSDQSSCEAAGFYEGAGCSGGSFSDESSCTGAGYYGDSTCSNSAYTDELSCTSASYTTDPGCSNPGYTDQYSCESATYTTDPGCSNSSYGDESSCTGAGYYESDYCSDPSYGSPEDCSANGGSWNTGSFVNYGYSWDPGSPVNYGYTWDPGGTVNYGYTWDAGPFSSYGYTWNPGTFSSYNYSWSSGSYTPHVWTYVAPGEWNTY